MNKIIIRYDLGSVVQDWLNDIQMHINSEENIKEFNRCFSIVSISMVEVNGLVLAAVIYEN